VKWQTRYKWLLFLLLVFMAGSAVGVGVQHSIGVGNILRTMGYPYPTRQPSPTTVPIVSVEIPKAYQGQLALFILAGQSNMSGVGPVPVDTPSTSSQIYLFGNDYHWHFAQEPVDSSVGQVDAVSQDNAAGISPGLAFAMALLAIDPERPIGLIPCAKGFTTIGQWQRNLSDNSLYGSCLKRARAASTMGETAGILFFQGENDALDPTLYPDVDPQPNQWAERFIDFVDDFRLDLQNPNLPVIFAQIGTHTAPEVFTGWEIVQRQQASIRLLQVAMIRTSDLELLDGVHYTAGSYQEIGSRYAQAYWQLIQEQSHE